MSHTMTTHSETRIAELEARIAELETELKEFEDIYLPLHKENEKLKKEKSVLMAVAAGNYKRGDEFKAICREYFTAEYINSCARGMDSALVSEYFRDTEDEETDDEDSDDEN